MKINQESPWFLAYTALASAIAVVVVYWLTDDDVNWGMVVLLAAASVVGVLIGRRIRSKRSS